MIFDNRIEAGKLLANRVDQFLKMELPNEKNNVVVIGLPRGGVQVALEVARKLACPLDILVSKKLNFPDKPDLVVGAVSSDGVMVLNTELPTNRVWKRYVENQKKELSKQTREAESCIYKFANRKPSSLENKIVIVVDDGLDTGMTATAALRTVRQRGAKMVYLAVPIMSEESIDFMNLHYDGVITVSVSEYLVSVDKHYVDFSKTTEDAVLDAMRESLSFVA
ncbi:phosphoribosyltransferase [bacterium]|nr:phosphoribosyltransferase [bacterium]QQR58027.1 MAG: phosphoribosyltransferase [Candidatus Melainabacteria bacterium]